MLLPKQSRNYVTGLAAACSLLLIACLSGGSPAGQSYSQTGTDDNDRRNFHGR